MQPKKRIEIAKTDQIIQLVIFHIRDEEFGVKIEDILEIIKVGHITSIPNTPKFIKGIINVRGDIVTTIDMKERFSIRGTESTPRHIVITRQNDCLFGLMVDEVTEVLRIEEREIKPAPPLIAAIHKEYVKGVVIYENRLLILLDLSHVLSQEEFNKLAEMSQQYQDQPLEDQSLQKKSIVEEDETHAISPIEETLNEKNIRNKKMLKRSSRKHL